MAMNKYGVNKEYDEGAHALLAGKPLTDCPYPAGSPEADNWKEGWHEQAQQEANDYWANESLDD